eukprot:m.226980 g.226980  ORF g.226980 m.226980 type:complete len:125 (+) comp10847_c1_seq23:654-1028(+)
MFTAHRALLLTQLQLRMTSGSSLLLLLFFIVVPQIARRCKSHRAGSAFCGFLGTVTGSLPRWNRPFAQLPCACTFSHSYSCPVQQLCVHSLLNQQLIFGDVPPSPTTQAQFKQSNGSPTAHDGS